MVAESFLPRVNGVSGSVLRSARHLIARGHHVDIIAPDPAPNRLVEGARIHTVRSVSIPGMAVDLGCTSVGRLQGMLNDLAPDVVHLASPLVLGHQALRAAQSSGVPTVAVYQTDVTGFARHYGLSPVVALADSLIRRVHTEATLTLAPSTDSLAYLSSLGVMGARLWRRGVDAEQFHPQWRSQSLRSDWLGGESSKTIVGYIGRLAPEKKVHLLHSLVHHPRIQLVLVGDGPSRAELTKLMPGAIFTGLLTGEALGRAAASMDIVVAPGERETFCQVVQEAMASGVPVIAPAIGGPRDLVEHDVTGLLYSPGDAAGLVSSVNALEGAVDRRRIMGQRGRATVENRSWSNTVDELIGHYEYAIERTSLRRAAA